MSKQILPVPESLRKFFRIYQKYLKILSGKMYIFSKFCYNNKGKIIFALIVVTHFLDDNHIEYFFMLLGMGSYAKYFYLVLILLCLALYRFFKFYIFEYETFHEAKKKDSELSYWRFFLDGLR